MKKRLMVGLLAGGLAAAMLPGVASSGNGPPDYWLIHLEDPAGGPCLPAVAYQPQDISDLILQFKDAEGCSFVRIVPRISFPK